MRSLFTVGLVTGLMTSVARLAVAQHDTAVADTPEAAGTVATTTDSAKKAAPRKVSLYRPLEIDHIRRPKRSSANAASLLALNVRSIRSVR